MRLHNVIGKRVVKQVMATILVVVRMRVKNGNMYACAWCAEMQFPTHPGAIIRSKFMSKLIACHTSGSAKTCPM